MRLLTALFIASAAFAARAETIDTKDIVAAATGDFDKNGASDLVLLMRNGDEDMDLRFFLQDADGKYLEPALVAKAKVWGHAEPEGIVGQEPELKVLPSGSIQIVTRNDAVGRDRWEETLTIAYRNKDFVVAGITYTWHDTLDPNNNGVCDINLLAGKGTVETGTEDGDMKKSPVRIAPATILLKDWSEDNRPEACNG